MLNRVSHPRAVRTSRAMCPWYPLKVGCAKDYLEQDRAQHREVRSREDALGRRYPQRITQLENSKSVSPERGKHGTVRRDKMIFRAGSRLGEPGSVPLNLTLNGRDKVPLRNTFEKQELQNYWRNLKKRKYTKVGADFVGTLKLPVYPPDNPDG